MNYEAWHQQWAAKCAADYREHASEVEANRIRAWALSAGMSSQQWLVVTRTHGRAAAILRALERRKERGDLSFRSQCLFSFLRGATVRVFAIASAEDYRIAGLRFDDVYWADPPASKEVAAFVRTRVRSAETPTIGEIGEHPAQGRELLEDAQKISDVPFHGAALKSELDYGVMWDSNPLYRRLVQRSRDELTGTG